MGRGGRMKQKEIKSRCPYGQNYDCICRAGLDCGGYTLNETHFPTECPYYKPIDIRALDNIVTKLLNECEACPKNRGNGGNCTKAHCRKYTAIDVLNDLKERFKRSKRLNK